MADTITDLEIAFPAFYTAIVLLASRFCRKNGVIIVGAGCIGLSNTYEVRLQLAKTPSLRIAIRMSMKTRSKKPLRHACTASWPSHASVTLSPPSPG